MSTRWIEAAHVTVLFLLLALPSNADLGVGKPYSHAKTCATTQRKVVCGQDKGIFYRYNTSDWRSISKPRQQLPLRAGIADKLYVTVCNYGNSEISTTQTLTAPQLPTLVRGVGTRASVSVFIINSGNMMVSNALQLRTMGKGTVRASLVGNAVRGTIGAEAAIFVAIRNSGNIFLQATSRALEIRRAELVSEAVISKNRRKGCIRDACIEVEITDSGNVMGRKGGKSGVGLTLGGTLLRAGISTRCANGGVQIANIIRSGNMYEVEGASLQGSSLVLPPIVSGRMKTTRLSSFVTASANVEVRSDILMARSWLSWGLVRLSKATDLKISTQAANLANMQASRHNRSASGAVSDVVSVGGNTKKVIILGTAKNLGNVDAKSEVILESSASCLRTLVRLEGCSFYTKVQAILSASCNLRSAKKVILKRSELVSNVVLASHAVHLLAKVKMMKTANTYVSGTTVLREGGVLVRAIVEVQRTTKMALVLAISEKSSNVERTAPKSLSCTCSSARFMQTAVILDDVDNGAVVKCAIKLTKVANSLAKPTKPRTFFGHAFVSARGADKIQVEQNTVGKTLYSFK